MLLLLMSFSVSIVFLPSTHPHSQCQRSGPFHPSLGTAHHPLSRRKRVEEMVNVMFKGTSFSICKRYDLSMSLDKRRKDRAPNKASEIKKSQISS